VVSESRERIVAYTDDESCTVTEQRLNGLHDRCRLNYESLMGTGACWGEETEPTRRRLCRVKDGRRTGRA
jgi:hypothetical protein